MIREIQIENFKSIRKMKLELGRVNVFIGENGSGKSNVLEAIALAGAATANKLDNEFLASRGIRAVDARHMRCALPADDKFDEIRIEIDSSNSKRALLKLSHDGKPYSSWQRDENGLPFINEDTVHVMRRIARFLAIHGPENGKEPIAPQSHEDLTAAEVSELLGKMQEIKSDLDASTDIVDSLTKFVIYSPENQSLRVFQREGQIEPLGIHGEGLLKFLQVLNEAPEYSDALASLRAQLRVLGWFEDLHIPDSTSILGSKIEIKDKFLSEHAGSLDQISANEGFLFLLFYFCLFSTDLTPRFFAIDNVDASLNPKLCAHLVREMVKLASSNEKQVILTTHNPATLDGVNLNDDEQRLFVISRGDEGETKIRRIKQKDGSAADVKLSTAFINGYLGGLPKNF